jgi:hypothetical protein
LQVELILLEGDQERLWGGGKIDAPTFPLIFSGAISDKYTGPTHKPTPEATPTKNLVAVSLDDSW